MTTPLHPWGKIERFGDESIFALENHNKQFTQQKYKPNINYKNFMEELFRLIKGEV